MRYAILAAVLCFACSSADNGAGDTVKVTDSVVVDSGPGKDTLVADTLFFRDHKKPKKEKK